MASVFVEERGSVDDEVLDKPLEVADAGIGDSGDVEVVEVVGVVEIVEVVEVVEAAVVEVAVVEVDTAPEMLK